MVRRRGVMLLVQGECWLVILLLSVRNMMRRRVGGRDVRERKSMQVLLKLVPWQKRFCSGLSWGIIWRQNRLDIS